MLSDAQRRFLESRRVAYLATADARGAPHVIPVCFVVDAAGVYITIVEKPKRVAGRALKRLRNTGTRSRSSANRRAGARVRWTRVTSCLRTLSTW